MSNKPTLKVSTQKHNVDRVDVTYTFTGITAQQARVLRALVNQPITKVIPGLKIEPSETWMKIPGPK